MSTSPYVNSQVRGSLDIRVLESTRLAHECQDLNQSSSKLRELRASAALPLVCQSTRKLRLWLIHQNTPNIADLQEQCRKLDSDSETAHRAIAEHRRQVELLHEQKAVKNKKDAALRKEISQLEAGLFYEQDKKNQNLGRIYTAGNALLKAL